mmetsp:Transcript_2641/g.9160  ORF Transcript_2641/g.9160 Transcript_2641/m.9160 type:complete len:234 (+) Transcript_2641:2096-2797(+)
MSPEHHPARSIAAVAIVAQSVTDARALAPTGARRARVVSGWTMTARVRRGPCAMRSNTRRLRRRPSRIARARNATRAATVAPDQVLPAASRARLGSGVARGRARRGPFAKRSITRRWLPLLTRTGSAATVTRVVTAVRLLGSTAATHAQRVSGWNREPASPGLSALPCSSKQRPRARRRIACAAIVTPAAMLVAAPAVSSAASARLATSDPAMARARLMRRARPTSMSQRRLP